VRRKPTKAQLKAKRKRMELKKRELVNDLKRQLEKSAERQDVAVQNEEPTGDSLSNKKRLNVLEDKPMTAGIEE
jgi:hypothetical protein